MTLNGYFFKKILINLLNFGFNFYPTFYFDFFEKRTRISGKKDEEEYFAVDVFVNDENPNVLDNQNKVHF